MLLPGRQPPKKQPGQGRGPRCLGGKVLGVRECAAFLGGTEKHMRGLIARRLIPFRRLGGRIIFLRAEVEAWLENLPGCTADEARGNIEARHA